jgi:hypothetical protein
MMDAHVKAYYDDIEAYYDDIESQVMKAAEDRWVDAGCPSNGFYDY